jgi:hypothetical protein
VSWEHFVDLCIRTYWLGVADNWGKAEGMENPLSFMAIVCITGSTVYHVFFFHHLSLFIGGTCQLFVGRSCGHFRRRRGGNWLENLAKHLARRLFLLLFSRGWIDFEVDGR